MGGKPRPNKYEAARPVPGIPLNAGATKMLSIDGAAVIRAHAQHFVGWCACCESPAEGNYSIHRDGFDDGPEVWLCDKCGSKPTPTCEEIWERIAENKAMWSEFERVLKEGA